MRLLRGACPEHLEILRCARNDSGLGSAGYILSGVVIPIR